MKETLKLVGILLLVAVALFGIGGCKYALWRAEHPGAKTWTFFIPK